jgi:hypothetical protein
LSEAAEPQRKHPVKGDAQNKIIRAPQTNTATLAKLAQICGPSYPLALRMTPTTAIRMYGTGIRKSTTATASGKLIATDAIAAAVAMMLAIVP